MIRLTTPARNLLLALGALLALFVATKGADGERAPITQIPAATPIDGLTDANTQGPQPRAPLLIGDRSLRGEIDLNHRERTGDHYEVKLSDGSAAVLTLQPAAQEAAEKVLAQAKSPMGAAVVMSVDGRILALAGRRQEETALEDQFDLALSIWAPAASVFKIVTASALLASGVKAKQKICYHGGVRSVDASNLVDSPRRDGACNDLGFGVAKSQNALIAKLASKHLDPASLGNMAANFGFGESPNFALDFEPGRLQVPSDKLEFARVSAGFWSSELSPLGAALAANVIASNGIAVTPRIVSQVREQDRVIPVVTDSSKRVLGDKIAREVNEMMTGTVRYGTAYKAFHDKRGRPYLGSVKVAGKTGSLSRSTPSYLGYSWFVGFAPADDPQVVIAVLLGNSALWHLKAHTAARLILDTLL